MIEFVDVSFVPIDYAQFLVAGFFSKIFGGSSSKGGSVDTTSVPGIFDDGANETGKEIANFLLDKGKARFDKTIDPFVIPDSTPSFDFDTLLGESDFGQQYKEELLNPSFGVSQAEQALLDQVTEQFLGNQALRNLNATGEGFADVLAPELVQFRKDRLNNLQNAFSNEINAVLSGRQQDVTERASDLDALTTTRGQDIVGEQAIFDEGANLLLALADLSRPTPVVKGGSSTNSGGGILGGLANVASLGKSFGLF